MCPKLLTFPGLSKPVSTGRAPTNPQRDRDELPGLCTLQVNIKTTQIITRHTACGTATGGGGQIHPSAAEAAQDGSGQLQAPWGGCAQPARHRMLTAGGREKACDGGALSAVRTAEESRHKRALQSR